MKFKSHAHCAALFLTLLTTGQGCPDFSKNASHFDVLGVSEGASVKKVKKAYRKRSLVCHPDKSKDADASRKFNQVREAYETLSDPTKRQEYLQQRNEELLYGRGSGWGHRQQDHYPYDAYGGYTRNTYRYTDDEYGGYYEEYSYESSYRRAREQQQQRARETAARQQREREQQRARAQQQQRETERAESQQQRQRRRQAEVEERERQRRAQRRREQERQQRDQERLEQAREEQRLFDEYFRQQQRARQEQHERQQEYVRQQHERRRQRAQMEQDDEVVVLVVVFFIVCALLLKLLYDMGDPLPQQPVVLVEGAPQATAEEGNSSSDPESSDEDKHTSGSPGSFVRSSDDEDLQRALEMSLRDHPGPATPHDTPSGSEGEPRLASRATIGRRRSKDLANRASAAAAELGEDGGPGLVARAPGTPEQFFRDDCKQSPDTNTVVEGELDPEALAVKRAEQDLQLVEEFARGILERCGLRHRHPIRRVGSTSGAENKKTQ